MKEVTGNLWRRLRMRLESPYHAAHADAFIVSYPKSGRTWFRFILSHYFSAVAGSQATTNLHNMFSVLPNFDFEPLRGIPAFHFRDADIPKLLVSHLGYRRTWFLNRPVIMMVRDPRDVIVSAYFHATRHKHRFEGSLSDFIDNEEQGLPAMVAYLNNWARGLAGRRSHVLSYEKLSADTVGEVAAVLAFLGRRLDPIALVNAVDAASFAKMQDQEKEEGLPGHHYDRSDMESLRMRKGKAGGFRDYLDEAQVAQIEAFCIRNLTPAGKALISRTGIFEHREEEPVRAARSTT